MARGVAVKSVHVTELRSALDTALSDLGITAGGYSNSAAAGTPVNAIDLQELRNRVQ